MIDTVQMGAKTGWKEQQQMKGDGNDSGNNKCGVEGSRCRLTLSASPGKFKSARFQVQQQQKLQLFLEQEHEEQRGKVPVVDSRGTSDARLLAEYALALELNI